MCKTRRQMCPLVLWSPVLLVSLFEGQSLLLLLCHEPHWRQGGISSTPRMLGNSLLIAWMSASVWEGTRHPLVEGSACGRRGQWVCWAGIPGVGMPGGQVSGSPKSCLRPSKSSADKTGSLTGLFQFPSPSSGVGVGGAYEQEKDPQKRRS